MAPAGIGISHVCRKYCVYFPAVTGWCFVLSGEGMPLYLNIPILRYSGSKLFGASLTKTSKNVDVQKNLGGDCQPDRGSLATGCNTHRHRCSDLINSTFSLDGSPYDSSTAARETLCHSHWRDCRIHI